MNEVLGKISSVPSDQRQNSQWLIRFAAEFFRATLRQLASPQVEPTDGQKEVANFAARLRTTSDPIDAVGRMLDRSIEAAIHLDRNVPVALCLESLFDDLARSIRVATQSRS